MKVDLRPLFLGLVTAVFVAPAGIAFPVGERHLVAKLSSAEIRDATHSDQLRITVWYPAADGSVEESLDIGPPGRPLFRPGVAAPDAPFAGETRRPVVLLSHGFGGTARIMAWFGTALAKSGYVVIAVDHPGNNGLDPMTIAGAAMFWERPGDLDAALRRVEVDPLIASHVDPSRLGVAGFSAGGFTALAAAGGRVELQRYRAFCKARPMDGVCKPQREFSLTLAQAENFLAKPEIAPEVARSNVDLSIAGVRAAFVMAPAIIQSFEPASLTKIRIPVHIVLGDADEVAPPATNGEAAAKLIPMAKIDSLPHVGHYDFIAECTHAGDAEVAICRTRVPRQRTHAIAIAEAVSFFNDTLDFQSGDPN